MKKLNLLIVFAILFFSCSKESKKDVSVENKTVTETKESQKVITPKKYYIGQDDYKTPYYVFEGEKKGATVIIDGGIHGDELSGYMACDTLVKYLQVTEGTVIVIPRLNLKACEANQRGLKHDFNRSFPGDKYSSDYEFKLAYTFMAFVDSVKPVCVINNHEARTRYNYQEYIKNPDKAFGQVLITCIKPYEEFLEKSLVTLNSKISSDEFAFNIQHYPIQPNHSLDNIVSKLNIKSYTVETYRGYKLPDRIKMHIMADLSFLETAGVKYLYPELKLN